MKDERRVLMTGNDPSLWEVFESHEKMEEYIRTHATGIDPETEEETEEAKQAEIDRILVWAVCTYKEYEDLIK